jgi:hypothetical protein
VNVKFQALGTTDDMLYPSVMMNHLYFSLDLMLDYILALDQAVSGGNIPNSSGEFGGSSSAFVHFSFL